MISAIYALALTTGANRVVRGARIEHVCGDPSLGPEKDYAYGMRIVTTALNALTTPVAGPTLFDPLAVAEKAERERAMRLEMGTFPVRALSFGDATRYRDGHLEVDREAALAAVRRDARIVAASLEIARPGESVRIWPVRDVIEPRIKVEGPGVCYPGVCGRDIATVGTGRTHRLAGMGVVEVSSVNWHDSGGDFVETYLDMSGPYAEMYPYAALQNLCAVVEPDPALNDEARNDAAHAAALAVSDHVAAATLGLTPPAVEEWSLRPVDPALPKVAYIWGVHSPQAMSGSMTAFCTAIFGLTRLTPPWLLHPNEILDGALSGPYRTAFAMSWTVANNPLFLTSTAATAATGTSSA